MHGTDNFSFDHDVDAPLRGEAQSCQSRNGQPAGSPRPGRAGASGRLPGQAGHGCGGALVQRRGWGLQDISVGRLQRNAPPFDTLSDCQRACLPD